MIYIFKYSDNMVKYVIYKVDIFVKITLDISLPTGNEELI